MNIQNPLDSIIGTIFSGVVLLGLIILIIRVVVVNT